MGTFCVFLVIFSSSESLDDVEVLAPLLFSSACYRTVGSQITLCSLLHFISVRGIVLPLKKLSCQTHKEGEEECSVRSKNWRIGIRWRSNEEKKAWSVLSRANIAVRGEFYFQCGANFASMWAFPWDNLRYEASELWCKTYLKGKEARHCTHCIKHRIPLILSILRGKPRDMAPFFLPIIFRAIQMQMSPQGWDTG